VSKRFSGTIDVDTRDSPPITEAVADLSGEEYLDLGREALAMMKRE
jgi:hypothetical protein